MRLADDERGRVPFALVGILLVLGATTFAATSATRGPEQVDRRVDQAADRAVAASHTALRSAVQRAAHRAAAAPVTTPANTTAGRALNDTGTFEDALRLRIYATARRHLAAVSYRTGPVTARVSLPAATTTAELRAAKRRVSLSPAANGTALDVTVRNVTVVVSRDGRVVDRRERDRTLRVDTPVLAAHERTRRFEERLNRGPLNGSGLGRQLTARLGAIAWARGYAQWAGAPVSNVVATRHVELAANGGVLAQQRAAFGRATPGGRAVRWRAAQRVAAADLATPFAPVASPGARFDPGGHGDARSVGSTGRSTGTVTKSFAATSTAGRSLSVPAANGSNRTLHVGVDDTADRALAALLDGTGGPGVPGTIRTAYGARVALRTAVDTTSRESRPRPRPPAPGFSLVAESVTRESTATAGDGPSLTTDPGWYLLHRTERHVRVERTVERTWRRDNQTRVTRAAWTERARVTVGVVGRPRLVRGVPNDSVEVVFRRGGPLDGPNLADVRAAAPDYLSQWGGADTLAAAVVERGAVDASTTAIGARPPGIEPYAVRGLVALHRQVRNASVTVRATDVAAGRSNPRQMLAARLDSRRSALLGEGPSPDVASRARRAVAAAYLDRVIDRLDGQGAVARRTGSVVDTALDGAGDQQSLGDVVESGGEAAVRPTRSGGFGSSVDGGGTVAPGGPTRLAPETDLPYLPATPVDGEHLAGVPADATYHPLVTRNTNVFTVPYGEATDALFEAVDQESGEVGLGTAARALQSANETIEASSGPTPELTAERDELGRAVRVHTRGVEVATEEVLTRRTALSRAERRTVVDEALAAHASTHARALAMANESFSQAVARETVARAGLTGVAATTRSTRVRVAVDAAVDERRVGRVPVNDTAAQVRDVARQVAKESVKSAAGNLTERVHRKHLGEALGSVPAGLPLFPPAGAWYATVNLWDVEVAGTYPAFAVGADRSRGGTRFRYVRDGGTVRADVDGDGGRERLGRNDRVSFRVRTLVPVVVPPGTRGVGDVTGDADERSAGWRDPGCGLNATCTTGADAPAGAEGSSEGNTSADPERVDQRPSGSRDGRG